MSRRSKNRQQRELDHLRMRIERAFSSVSYPGDDNLVSGKEDTDVGILLRGKRWQDITPGVRRGSHWIKKRPDLLQDGVDFPLHFLTLEAYIFYFPAFLIACLDYDTYDVVADSTIRTLSPLHYQTPHLERYLSNLMERIHRLDEDQKKVTHDVFVYLRKFGTYVTDDLESAVAAMEQF